MLAVDVVSDHARFQRPGAKQRNQRHDLVEGIGLQAADQVFHAARFQLEYGRGAAGAQQPEGLLIIQRQLLEHQRRLAFLLAQAVHCLHGPVNDGQGPQPQEIELDQPDGFDIVLVELRDHVAATRFTVQRREVR